MKKVIRFTASWCQPCKALASVLEDITTEVPIEVVDIDSNPAMATQYRVRGVPTLIMIKDDQEIKRMSGVKAKNLVEEWINS